MKAKVVPFLPNGVSWRELSDINLKNRDKKYMNDGYVENKQNGCPNLDKLILGNNDFPHSSLALTLVGSTRFKFPHVFGNKAPKINKDLHLN